MQVASSQVLCNYIKSFLDVGNGSTVSGKGSKGLSKKIKEEGKGSLQPG